MSISQEEIISVSEIDGLIRMISELIGVKPKQLRSGRTINRARPYRHAIWKLLVEDYNISQRWMAEYFRVSRNTIADGIKAFEQPDEAHMSALAIVRARLNRINTGV